jgi:CubicO group peptidase (beta-lactamase class C family)
MTNGRKIVFALLAAIVAGGGTGSATQSDPRIRRVEATVLDLSLSDNDAPLHLNLAQLMAAYDVPGLSIAVIDHFRIAWAKGYGVSAAGSNVPVGTGTLFQAASISKPVTAAGALALVEQGKLSLNGNVNDKLTSWKVPENEFTQEQKVTLRRLISHIGGLNVHGFAGYPVNAPLPTLVEILNGAKPANNVPIRVGFVPGSKESYSGGGIVVEQQLMMDATGRAFPELMHGLVLAKAGMTESGFDQPLPPARAAMAASGTRQNGSPVAGKWYVYPELAPAGLWTTPTDLAKFAIEIAQSRNGVSNKVLSKAMTETMLTRWPDGGAQCFHMDANNPGQFSHNGENEGFEGLLNMNWKTGNGIVMLANSENGEFLWDLITRSVAREYGWNYKFSGEPGTLVLVARLRGAEAALRRFGAMKAAGAPEDQMGEKDLNEVGYAFLLRGDNRDAIAVFERNVREYPQSANVYDSLGEAYMKARQKALAIGNYEKSLQLNPASENAKRRLKDLHETP